MGLVECIHPSLAEADYQKTSTKLFFICASFIFFGTVYLLSAVFGSLTKTYRNLKSKEKIFWNLAVVRGVYGSFCTVVGVWAIFFDTELLKDPVFSTTPTSYFALATSLGFFVFECGTLLISDMVYKKASVMLNVHHWMALLGFVLLMYLDSAHYFGVRGLLLEMSTPFSAICWTLLKASKAHTLLWKANQFLLVHTFHLRSVVECYIWYVTYQNWERIWSAMPTTMFISLYSQLVLVTFLMTPYWTYKKTQQMITPVDWNFEDSGKNKSENGSVSKKAI
ncbi:protein CLN8-like [Mizuhopecten yessoensis]|uniref:Protein CLN8 n=1 Tax=Mizuhopecten yessoensis TaxID=6573 RepID=A0A210QHV3_MIZYE|nr:protein CLN8-like [Mizuhopecten yessoensis]OWF48317.1 Protein CLN8 [Mizuhopecten yessoensis]